MAAYLNVWFSECFGRTGCLPFFKVVNRADAHSGVLYMCRDNIGSYQISVSEGMAHIFHSGFGLHSNIVKKGDVNNRELSFGKCLPNESCLMQPEALSR